MKFTYLVYKQVNGTRQLAAATQEEWDAILKKNRRLPLEQRRRFMKDCIEDGDEVDCMYIEVPPRSIGSGTAKIRSDRRIVSLVCDIHISLWTPESRILM